MVPSEPAKPFGSLSLLCFSPSLSVCTPCYFLSPSSSDVSFLACYRSLYCSRHLYRPVYLSRFMYMFRFRVVFIFIVVSLSLSLSLSVSLPLLNVSFSVYSVLCVCY